MRNSTVSDFKLGYWLLIVIKLEIFKIQTQTTTAGINTHPKNQNNRPRDSKSNIRRLTIYSTEFLSRAIIFYFFLGKNEHFYKERVLFFRKDQ